MAAVSEASPERVPGWQGLGERKSHWRRVWRHSRLYPCKAGHWLSDLLLVVIHIGLGLNPDPGSRSCVSWTLRLGALFCSLVQ